MKKNGNDVLPTRELTTKSRVYSLLIAEMLMLAIPCRVSSPKNGNSENTKTGIVVDSATGTQGSNTYWTKQLITH